MPLGLLMLLAVAALIYFGFAQRVLDRMGLTDRGALLFIGAMILGSFIDIPLFQNGLTVSINVGGALIPLALGVFLLTRADETRERVRALLALLVTAGIIWAITKLTTFESPERSIIDPLWLFALIGGLCGYLAGRSRRGAFIAGSLGILLTDFFSLAEVITRRQPATMAIGGAGVFDSIVLGGIIAVGLAELVGETRERLGGGPVPREVPEALMNTEMEVGEEINSAQRGEDGDEN